MTQNYKGSKYQIVTKISKSALVREFSNVTYQEKEKRWKKERENLEMI